MKGLVKLALVPLVVSALAIGCSKSQGNNESYNSQPSQNQPAQTQRPDPRNFKDYFLQGSELQGIIVPSLTKSQILSGASQSQEMVQLPYVFSSQDLESFKARFGSVLPYYNLIDKMGASFYGFNTQQNIASDYFTQTVMQFSSPNTEKQFMEGVAWNLQRHNNRDYHLFFVNGNTASEIDYGGGSQEDAQILFNSMAKYAKRIGGKVYRYNSNDGNFENYASLKQALSP